MLLLWPVRKKPFLCVIWWILGSAGTKIFFKVIYEMYDLIMQEWDPKESSSIGGSMTGSPQGGGTLLIMYLFS